MSSKKGYLAGDIGGTNTRLILFTVAGEEITRIKDQKFPSRNYAGLIPIVREFLSDSPSPSVSVACFGIAGPVQHGKTHTTNLLWDVDTKIVSRELAIDSVSLMNDLEANAYGLRMLSEGEFCVLQKGDPEPRNNQAILSVGTGLGEAGIYYDGKEHRPFACEGGHTDFAARSESEDDLLKYLRKRFAHVSYERILSGLGLCSLHAFLVYTGREKESPDVLRRMEVEGGARIIVELGMKGMSNACVRALELFASICGAEAGNVALKFFALGGVFIGGGIPPRVLPFLKERGFMEGFLRKGRFRGLLERIPVKLVLNDETALLGAMHCCMHPPSHPS